MIRLANNEQPLEQRTQFCVRDDDTSFFTTPDALELAYGEITKWGPVSLAVVPFHRAGTSKGVPERFRGRWSIHPLHENQALVSHLRLGVAQGRFEIMLHGYYHDEMDHRPEFAGGEDLIQRVSDGRKYLEDLLGTAIRVFVPPRNAIGPKGLRAVVLAGLHLGGTAGLRKGWSPFSTRSWAVWRRLRSWRKAGRVGTPWILDLGDHREIPGNAVTPSSTVQQNEAIFQCALSVTGVFCAAAHYWELGSPSIHADQPTVGEQLQSLVYQARSNPQVVWQSVGQIVSESKRVV